MTISFSANIEPAEGCATPLEILVKRLNTGLEGSDWDMEFTNVVEKSDGATVDVIFHNAESADEARDAFDRFREAVVPSAEYDLTLWNLTFIKDTANSPKM